MADPDPTLGNDDDIANWICMLVTTCADGTLLCPISFQQEDAVAMFEGCNQECPEGMLQLMATEMVLTLQSDCEMMATIHWLTAAMVWHGNPILLHIQPLSTNQVRDYKAMRSSHPSGTSAQAPDEGLEIQPPPSNPAKMIGSKGH